MMVSPQISGNKFSRKRKMQSDTLVDKTHRKICGKVEISKLPMMQRDGIQYHIKGEEKISVFDLRKLKILSVQFGIFNICTKELNLARRVG